MPNQATAGLKTKRYLLGTAVHAATLGEVLEACAGAIAERNRLTIGVVNAAKLVNMQKDPALRAAVESCDLTLADGQSVVWASRLLGAPLPERVAGIDLFLALLEQASLHGHRVFFLGAQADVLSAVLDRVREQSPGLVVAGARHGYYRSDEEGDVAREIAASGADMLFLGMTSPRKEVFVDRWSGVLDVPIILGVGGSFDVVAGLTRRAPRHWQALGFEWLYRLLQEPRRLLWRYTRTNTLFLAAVASEVVRHLPRRRREAML